MCDLSHGNAAQLRPRSRREDQAPDVRPNAAMSLRKHARKSSSTIEIQVRKAVVEAQWHRDFRRVARKSRSGKPEALLKDPPCGFSIVGAISLGLHGWVISGRRATPDRTDSEAHVTDEPSVPAARSSRREVSRGSASCDYRPPALQEEALGGSARAEAAAGPSSAPTSRCIGAPESAANGDWSRAAKGRRGTDGRPRRGVDRAGLTMSTGGRRMIASGCRDRGAALGLAPRAELALEHDVRSRRPAGRAKGSSCSSSTYSSVSRRENAKSRCRRWPPARPRKRARDRTATLGDRVGHPPPSHAKRAYEDPWRRVCWKAVPQRNPDAFSDDL